MPDEEQSREAANVAIVLAVLKALCKRGLITEAESEVSDGCDGTAEELAVEMDGHQEAIMELLKKKTRGAITDKEYEDEVAYHKNRLDGLALKRETLLTNQSKMQLAKYRTDAIVELLQNGHILQEFDRVIFKSLVRKMKVINGKEVEIEFECGIKIRETVK